MLITTLIALPVQYFEDRKVEAESKSKDTQIAKLLQQGDEQDKQMIVLQRAADEANKLKTGTLMPPTGIAGELLQVTIGGSVWASVFGPINGEDFVARRSKEDGTILISTTFYDADGNAAATIYNNTFERNNGHFNLEKPDSSTLKITGAGTRVVCKLVKPDVVDISGRFFRKGGVPVHVNPQGGITIGESYYFNNYHHDGTGARGQPSDNADRPK